VAWFNKPWLGHVLLDLKMFSTLPLILLAVEVFMRPTLHTYQFTFSEKASKSCHPAGLEFLLASYQL
jgi:hypothetical protein